MDTLLNDVQEEFARMVRRLANSEAIRSPRDITAADKGRIWEKLLSAGLLELRARDERGVAIGSGIEVMLACEAFGQALLPVPYGARLASVELLTLAHVNQDYLDAVTSGEQRCSVAMSRDWCRIAYEDELTGAFLFDGDAVDDTLVIDRAPKPSLMAIPARNLVLHQENLDLTRPLQVVMARETTSTPRTLGQELTSEDLQRWLALVLVATGADGIGLMSGLFARAVEYAKQRYAFGVPISSFQALQHLCADAYVQIEAARYLTKYAGWCVDALDSDAALLAARSAKAHVSMVVRDVVEASMQVFAGIGQTWEHSSHLFLRRGLLDRQMYGDENVHFQSIGGHRLVRQAARNSMEASQLGEEARNG
jgi:alkylation response protein AidB-like acyl-CoA dehydrogenase